MHFPHIVPIAIVPFGVVNCHLIVGPTACVLVDTGLPGSHRKIGKALRKHGRDFSDIALIVVTHAHVDHAGSAARLRQLCNAPIVAHRADMAYYAQTDHMDFCETGWAARLFMRTGLILQPYRPFTPDIVIEEGQALDLARWGIEGRVQSTPGHTAGSVSVVLASGDALVGDLIASGILLGGLARTGHAIRPPFEDDPKRVATHLLHLADGGCTHFHMGHGGPLPVAEVRRHALMLETLRAGKRFRHPASSRPVTQSEA